MRTPIASTALLSALALALVAAPGCIGKRRPSADQQAKARAKANNARLIQPEDVDGRFDSLVTGERLRARYNEQDPAKGAAIPLVTIIEFSDFQCPFCSRLATTLEDVAAEHPRDVKLVFKQFPLVKIHPQAEPAARAALAAHKQGKFWEMHDVMFANQKALGDSRLESYAQQLGLDMTKWKKDFASDALRKHVSEELGLGGKISVSSTPTFFINGRLFKGAQPAEKIRATVDEELLLARKLLEAGAKREELYARFIHPGAPVVAEPAPKVPAAAADKPEAKPAEPKPDPDHVPGEASRIPNYAVPVGEGRPSRGPADALVTIVEFGAFDCDNCRKLQPTLNKLQAKYPKDVRLVFRQLAATPSARRSAQIALAAHKQGKFWPAHDKLMAAEGDQTAETATTLAQDLGLDLEKFQQDLRDRGEGGALRQIQQDQAVVDVFRGEAPAPLLFVNGRYLDGLPTLDALDKLVAEAKAKAEAFVADKGVTDKGKLYEAMQRGWRGFAQVQKAAAAPAPAAVRQGG